MGAKGSKGWMVRRDVETDVGKFVECNAKIGDLIDSCHLRISTTQ